eukprot:sb/3479629/
MDLCIVPGVRSPWQQVLTSPNHTPPQKVTYGSTTPPTGFRVTDDTVVTLKCEDGKATDTDTFTCGSGIDPVCDAAQEVKDESDSTVTIVIIVVVIIVVALIVVAIFVIKKRTQVRIMVTQVLENERAGKAQGDTGH